LQNKGRGREGSGEGRGDRGKDLANPKVLAWHPLWIPVNIYVSEI